MAVVRLEVVDLVDSYQWWLKRRARRLLTFAAAGVLVTELVCIDLTLPWISHLSSTLTSVLFLYALLYVASRRGDDLCDYGFVTSRSVAASPPPAARSP